MGGLFIGHVGHAYTDTDSFGGLWGLWPLHLSEIGFNPSSPVHLILEQYIYIYIHTHIHTYIHIYIYIASCSKTLEGDKPGQKARKAAKAQPATKPAPKKPGALIAESLTCLLVSFVWGFLGFRVQNKGFRV